MPFPSHFLKLALEQVVDLRVRHATLSPAFPDRSQNLLECLRPRSVQVCGHHIVDVDRRVPCHSAAQAPSSFCSWSGVRLMVIDIMCVCSGEGPTNTHWDERTGTWAWLRNFRTRSILSQPLDAANSIRPRLDLCDAVQSPSIFSASVFSASTSPVLTGSIRSSEDTLHDSGGQSLLDRQGSYTHPASWRTCSSHAIFWYN